MKKLLLLTLVLFLTQISRSQTLHKQYMLNYCGTGECYHTTVINGGGFYMVYVEDSLTFGASKHNMVLQKNDLNGNLIWKRTFQYSGAYKATATPRKLLAAGANIYIGGNLMETTGNYPFIASVDTTSGNVNYFNKYTSSFSSTDIKINDITLLNNGDVMAVGRIANTTSKFLYALRVVGTTGAIVNNGMSTYYSDQEANSVCQFSNGTIFIVGSRGLYPFIAKLSNNAMLTPIGSYWLAGSPTMATFNQIIKAGNNLVVMGATGGATQNNFICKVDSTVNMSVGSPYIYQMYSGNSFIPTRLYQNGSQTLVSGLAAGNTLLFYNSSLIFQSGKAYGSTASNSHNILFNNNCTYLTAGTWNTGSNITLYKGDVNGLTSCSTPYTPTQTLTTITYSLAQVGIFVSGGITPLTPLIYNKPITPVTTCLSTDINSNVIVLNEVKLFTANDAYIFNSPLETITEINIYDINGKLIESRSDLNSNEQTVSTSQYSAGLYFAKVNCGATQKVFKLIKQ